MSYPLIVGKKGFYSFSRRPKDKQNFCKNFVKIFSNLTENAYFPRLMKESGERRTKVMLIRSEIGSIQTRQECARLSPTAFSQGNHPKIAVTMLIAQ